MPSRADGHCGHTYTHQAVSASCLYIEHFLDLSSSDVIVFTHTHTHTHTHTDLNTKGYCLPLEHVNTYRLLRAAQAWDIAVLAAQTEQRRGRHVHLSAPHTLSAPHLATRRVSNTY